MLTPPNHRFDSFSGSPTTKTHGDGMKNQRDEPDQTTVADAPTRLPY
jgi:hypothetical protein